MTRQEQIKQIQNYLTNQLLEGEDWNIQINYQEGKLSTTVKHGTEMIGDGYLNDPKVINYIFALDPASAALVILNESIKLSVHWLEIHLKVATGFRKAIRELMKTIYEDMQKELGKDNEEVKH